MSKPIAIIEADFYHDIAEEMAASAIEEITSLGYKYQRFTVPGCFELPAALTMAIRSRKFSGYVALGCVIRGETSHYDYVCNEASHGINLLAMKGYPVGFGVITAENMEQAKVRANKDQKDIGGKAARACLSMIAFKRRMRVK